MSTSLVYDTARVFAFVHAREPIHKVEGMVGMGLEEDGRLTAGVLYERFNGKTVWLHVAVDPGSGLRIWSLRQSFIYPFLVLGVNAIRVSVRESNTRSRRFVERLGFHCEARLEGAAHDGGDVVIYRMKRSECRYV